MVEFIVFSFDFVYLIFAHISNRDLYHYRSLNIARYDDVSPLFCGRPCIVVDNICLNHSPRGLGYVVENCAICHCYCAYESGGEYQTTMRPNDN